MEGGMEPDNFLASRSKTMTRLLEGLHVTPNQLQKCVESFQELMIWSGSLLIRFLKSSNAMRSVSFAKAGIVADFKHVLMHIRRIPWKNISKTQS